MEEHSDWRISGARPGARTEGSRGSSSRLSSLPSQLRIQPLPVSNEIPLTTVWDRSTYPPRQNFQSSSAMAEPPNVESLPVSNKLTSGRHATLDRIEEKIGVDHIIFGAKFLLHSCVTYPFTVFSRQCQAIPYYTVGTLYTAPGSTLYVMNNITSSQGFLSWWRGFKANVICLLGRPFAAAALTWIAEKKSRSRKLSVTLNRIRSYFIYLIVDGLSYAVCLPLTSFILMECVQNTKQRTYNPDYYGFKEFTLERPLLMSNDPSKRISFLHLLLPTVMTNICCDILTQQVLRLVTQFPILRRAQSSQSHHLSPRSLLRQLWASYISSFIVDIVTYPLRTIVLRLHMQGLPILVENVETGIGVNYVTTYYTGPIDCTQSIWEVEGLTGFYKGLSSIVLQYSLYGLFLVIVWRGVLQWERLRDKQ